MIGKVEVAMATLTLFSHSGFCWYPHAPGDAYIALLYPVTDGTARYVGFSDGARLFLFFPFSLDSLVLWTENGRKISFK